MTNILDTHIAEPTYAHWARLEVLVDHLFEGSVRFKTTDGRTYVGWSGPVGIAYVAYPTPIGTSVALTLEDGGKARLEAAVRTTAPSDMATVPITVYDLSRAVPTDFRTPWWEWRHGTDGYFLPLDRAEYFISKFAPGFRLMWSDDLGFYSPHRRIIEDCPMAQCKVCAVFRRAKESLEAVPDSKE